MEKLNCWLLVPVCFIGLFLQGCVSMQQEYKGDLWEGNLTGGFEGKMQLYLDRSEGEDNAYNVSGPIDADFVIQGYGDGVASLFVKGKIKGGIVSLNSTGRIEAIQVGASGRLTGELIGTMGKTQAFGTYQFNAFVSGRTYPFEGEWSVEKADKNTN